MESVAGHIIIALSKSFIVPFCVDKNEPKKPPTEKTKPSGSGEAPAKN